MRKIAFIGAVSFLYFSVGFPENRIYICPPILNCVYGGTEQQNCYGSPNFEFLYTYNALSSLPFGSSTWYFNSAQIFAGPIICTYSMLKGCPYFATVEVSSKVSAIPATGFPGIMWSGDERYASHNCNTVNPGSCRFMFSPPKTIQKAPHATL